MRADHESVKRLLLTARGQIDGLIRMVDEDRYCMEVSNQILAALAVLKKANGEVIRAHLQGCFQNAMAGEDGKGKIEEIVALMDKLTK